jgi:Spy/CpxP family protein refolding chaperone
MNSRILTLLTGAIALSISSTLPAFAQSTTPTAPSPGHRMGHMKFLNLTAEQQAKIEQIRQNTRSQIDNILTAEQKAQLQRERENQGTPPALGGQGKRGGGFFASLNLTAEQRSQIEAVKRSAKEQIDAILTPEQRQQLQQRMQQRQQRRQGNPPATQNP